MTIAEIPRPTTIVFGTDGWRASVADDFTFENVRRCAEGVARYVVDRGRAGEGRRARLRPALRLGALRAGGSRGAACLRHPGRLCELRRSRPRCPSYEVVQRGAAAGIVITASHNPWTDNGFKVKSPTGAAAGPELLAVLERTIAANGATAIPRRPFADAEAAGLVERYDPYRRLRAVRPAHRRPRRAQGGRRDDSRGPDVGCRGDLDQPRSSREAGSASRSSIRAQPVLRRRQPRADPAQHRRGPRVRGGRRVRPRAPARRRRRPGRRDRRARHLRPPAPGERPAHVLPGRASRDARAGGQERQRDVDGRPPGQALRRARPRDAGRLQVRRAEDDRDRRHVWAARNPAATGSACTCPSATASTPT